MREPTSDQGDRGDLGTPEDPRGDRGTRWMLAYQAGSEEAFERLVEAYSGAVYGLLTRFLGPSPEREDLVQEVFLRVIRARERYQPAARFTTWLYRIVFNLAANQRERARPAASPAGAGPDSAGALEELADRQSGDPAADLERADVMRPGARGARPRCPRSSASP